MPFIDKIILTQFKNYPLTTFSFTERVVGIHGLNGKGKTNLLDAIYYLSFTKSYFSRTDNLSIRFNTDGFRLEGFFEDQKVVCINRGVGKKELWLNDILYNKFSEHIGKFPCVMIAPDDIELILGGSEERRRFIDTVLSQMDGNYLQQLIIYNKVLQQRNSVLKRFAEQRNIDNALLDVFDSQLIEPGNYIYQKRKEFTTALIPLVNEFYGHISNHHETITLEYDSKLNTQSLSEILTTNRDKDLMLQRTNGGIHKDDIDILLNETVFKNIASQGQRKSLLFALKLAEFTLLQQNKGFAPILLLDDVFEKLDEERMQNLLQWVCCRTTAQVFITDTHQQRLEDALSQLPVTYQLIHLEQA